jgi:hypothetical protein
MDKIFDEKSETKLSVKSDIKTSDDNELKLKKVTKPNDKKTKPKLNNNFNFNNNLCNIM